MISGVRGESIKYHTVVVICAAFLVAIWPLPGTMLVRNLLLLIGLMVAVPVIKNHISLFKSSTAWPIYVLFTFFVWLGVHYQFFAGNSAEQWNELISYWPRTLIACVLGLALGMVLTAAHNTTRELRLQTLLIVGFSGTVVIFCIRYAFEIYRTGQWLHHDFYMTPYLGKTPLVIFGSIFLPMVLIKILDALKGREHWRWYIFGLIGISATLLTYFFGNTKNGFAIFALLLGFFFLGAIQSLLKTHQSAVGKSAGLALVLVSLFVFGVAGKKHFESNAAWANLVADFKVSVQTDQHHYWKDKVSPLPINEYGNTVSITNYERTAWAKASLELLSEHPMGYGQINHSFGAMAIKKWTDFHPPDGINRGSSHSGWLDFALGFGVIGIVLVWVPLCTSFWRTRHAPPHFWQRYAFWTIPVIGFTYLTTEVCTGHFIELLFFMTAMFCGLTLKKSDAPSA